MARAWQSNLWVQEGNYQLMHPHVHAFTHHSMYIYPSRVYFYATLVKWYGCFVLDILLTSISIWCVYVAPKSVDLIHNFVVGGIYFSFAIHHGIISQKLKLHFHAQILNFCSLYTFFLSSYFSFLVVHRFLCKIEFSRNYFLSNVSISTQIVSFDISLLLKYT